MPRYETKDHRMYRTNDEGEQEMMCNFSAHITEEVRYIDGRTVDTVFTIEGAKPTADQAKPAKLPPVRVPAGQYPGMGWVIPTWGSSCVIMPGYGITNDLRAAIQLLSTPKVGTVYRHTGWTVIGGKRVFLHRGGGIGERGNDPRVRVELPPELSRFDLTRPKGELPGESIMATLQLLTIGPREVMWPLLCATLAPIFGPVDFAVHLSGRTGTFKSEIMSLFQSHYGQEMDGRHLPGSWSSTANALEAQAYVLKDVAFVCDDFIPAGSTIQQREYQRSADRLIRAQGNQAGRARLTDVSNLQTTMWPRGIVLSTGEDTPEGHSVRARMLIMELSPGDVSTAKLTKAQAARPLYAGTVAWCVQQLAGKSWELGESAKQLRDKYQGLGHSRTPSMVGQLLTVGSAFLELAEDVGVLSERSRRAGERDMTAAILEAAGRQQSYLETADPVKVFLATLRHIFQTGLGHLRLRNGGVPESPTLVGWSEIGGDETGVPEFKSHGPVIGWIDWDAGEILLDATSGLNIVRKAAGGELTATVQTLQKRLKDAGVLSRVDEPRQRNTVRITVEKHPRNVLAIQIAQVFEEEEETEEV